MLRFVESQRPVLIFLGVTTLIAVGSLVWPGTGWVLDLLTAIVAASVASMAGTRLALGTQNTAARRAWQAALILFGLVCVGQLAAPFGLATGFSIACLVLVAAAVVLWLVARYDSMPSATRGLLWSAFAV